jgi:phage-related protein
LDSEELKPVRWVVPDGCEILSASRPGRNRCRDLCCTKGETDPSAKALKGFGGRSVMEIVTAHIGDTWRTVYTVRIQDALYVLHAFQKKSKTGVATPKKEIDLVRQRLAEAERENRERQNGK